MLVGGDDDWFAFAGGAVSVADRSDVDADEVDAAEGRVRAEASW